MKLHASTAALSALLAVAGCSSMIVPMDANSPVDAVGADASDIVDATIDTGVDVPVAYVDTPDVPVPDAAMHEYTTGIGPIHLDVGQEVTMCVVQHLGNETAQYLRSIRAHLGPASHHLIFYRATETVEQPTPFACRGFSGVRSVTNYDSPLLIAQMTDARLDMPPAIGMRLGANQMVRIELHGINTTSAPLDFRADVTLDTVDQTVPLTPADILFWGNANIVLPPHAQSTVDFFHEPWGGVRIFGLTSHTHHLGVLATISTATNTTMDSAMAHDLVEVHRSTNWSDPPLTTFDPPLQLPFGQGLHLQCHYNNTTANTVTFGESFNDEMCFMWAYYWPAPRGTQACAEGYAGFNDGGVFCYPP